MITHTASVVCFFYFMYNLRVKTGSWGGKDLFSARTHGVDEVSSYRKTRRVLLR